MHIGIVKETTANLVKKKTGIDINGYDFVISSNFIQHIYNSHGNNTTEALSGQKAVNDSNIENIIETVISPDDVSLVSDSSGTALRFEKILDGRNVAITITSTKKSTLTLKSAWIINKKGGGRTPSANATALAGTPEANSRNSTTDSIPQTTEKSNSFSEKTSENSSENNKKTKYQLEAEEFDKLANKEVEGYKKLSEPNRAMIRKILRQAKARGMSETDALSLARVSAHSGVDIVVGIANINPNRTRFKRRILYNNAPKNLVISYITAIFRLFF